MGQTLPLARASRLPRKSPSPALLPLPPRQRLPPLLAVPEAQVLPPLPVVAEAQVLLALPSLPAGRGWSSRVVRSRCRPVIRAGRCFHSLRAFLLRPSIPHLRIPNP